MWVDNFSKFIARQVPTTGKGIFSSCLWTGVAVFECDNQQLDLSIKRSPNGTVRPAMPNDLLANRRSVVDGIKQVLRGSRNYYDVSLVQKYDVRCIPLKVNTKIHTNVAHIVDHVKNTTQIVHPVELIEHNIGSNQGLVTILRQLYEDRGMDNDTCDKYHILNVDENIYWRTLKVQVCFILFFTLFVYFIPWKKKKKRKKKSSME